MLVPFLAIAGAVLWFAGPPWGQRLLGRHSNQATGIQTTLDQELEHHGFLASAEIEGGTLRARLAPLHAAAERQTFDSLALGRRLGRQVGMPWRLDLERDPQASAPAWDLAGILVEAGEHILEPVNAADLELTDPLRPLLAIDPQGLAAGSFQTVLLWGPPELSSARLLAWGASIEMQPDSWAARGEDEALLRLEPTP